MKRINKFLALFLAVVLTVGMLPSAVFAATEDSNVIFEENFDGIKDSALGMTTGTTVYFENYWGGGANSVEDDGAGNKYVKLTTSASTHTQNGYLGEGAGWVDVRISNNEFEIGATYKATMWVKISAAVSGNNSNIMAQSPSGTVINVTNNGSEAASANQYYLKMTPGVWEQKELLFKIKSFGNRDFMQFRFGCGSTIGKDQYMLVDDIRIEKLDPDVVIDESFESWVSPDFTVAGDQYSVSNTVYWNGAIPAPGWNLGSTDGKVLVQPVVDSSVAYDGDVCMKLTLDSSNTATMNRRKLFYQIPKDFYDEMEDGGDYTLTFYVKGSVPKVSVEVKQMGLSADGTTWYNMDYAITKEWTKISYRFVLDKDAPKPAGVQYLEIYMGIAWHSANAYFGDLYIDNVSLVKTDYYQLLTEDLSNNNSVSMSKDVDGTGNDLVLKNGKTLDLAGNTLTVDSLSAMPGAKVIDSVGGGKIVVANDNLTLQADNGMLPIKTNAGYILSNVKLTNNELEDDGLDDIMVYETRPSLGAANNAAYLVDGAADNGLSIIIRLTWTNDSNGTTTTMDVPCSDEVIKDIYAAGSSQAIRLLVKGVDSVENLKVATVVTSNAGVTCVSDFLAYTAPIA